MKKISQFISAAILAMTMSFSAVIPAYAATQQTATGSGNGLKISPVRTDLTINPGTSQVVTINVQNVTSSNATFETIINDFVAGAAENGDPSLILNNNQYAPSHSLKRYIQPVPNFTIAAGQIKPVKVTIHVPSGAAGGGYYGAVRFAPVSTAGGGQNVTLSASVGSLILVKVPGNVDDNLTISSFDVRGSANSNSASSFYTSGKSLVGMVRFSNQGNVQEQPFGKIILKKGSKVLQTTAINTSDPAGNVLPSSIRRFSVPLTHVGSFGKYTIEGNFGYGSNGQLLSATSTFYVVPVGLIILAVAIIVLILLAVFALPRAVKNYNRRVLRRAGRR